ncbi:unnamed protein product, partial [Meganyctiphanes norvegica]
MFAKPFRIKSQTQLKGSDRKKLRSELTQNFPSLTADLLNTLIPNKEEVILLRMYCHKGETVNMYQVQKEPLFFMIDKEKAIYPTIFLLWKIPDLMPSMTTMPPVVERLTKGADLMLPGIVTKGPMNPKVYGVFERGYPVSINTTSNQAPIAVGVTAQSSMDLFMAARQGKGVYILHVLGDSLWEYGSRSPPPQLGPPEFVMKGQETEDLDDDDEMVNPGDMLYEINLVNDFIREDLLESVAQCSLGNEVLSVLVSFEDNAGFNQDHLRHPGSPEAMDALLFHCFLKAWKICAKHQSIEIPILTSNFYRLHVVPVCPDGRTLDVKKSSYKKLSKFLNEMAKKQIIQVKEFPKGIENITAVNWEHDDIKYFRVDKQSIGNMGTCNSSNWVRSFMQKKHHSRHPLDELDRFTESIAEVYRTNDLCKGDVLTTQEIRTVVTDYIKKHNLKAQGQNTVNVDPLLHEIVVNRKEGYKETLRWDEIFSRMLGKMSQAYRITKPGEVPIIKKGKLELIELAVAKRSGNKRVTLVYNAGVYGIDENAFAHQVQVGVAASTSVGPAEHKPMGTTQILIQGNQINFVAKLLLETYNLPRKYIRGCQMSSKTRF